MVEKNRKKEKKKNQRVVFIYTYIYSVIKRKEKGGRSKNAFLSEMEE